MVPLESLASLADLKEGVVYSDVHLRQRTIGQKEKVWENASGSFCLEKFPREWDPDPPAKWMFNMQLPSTEKIVISQCQSIHGTSVMFEFKRDWHSYNQLWYRNF